MARCFAWGPRREAWREEEAGGVEEAELEVIFFFWGGGDVCLCTCMCVCIYVYVCVCFILGGGTVGGQGRLFVDDDTGGGGGGGTLSDTIEKEMMASTGSR